MKKILPDRNFIRSFFTTTIPVCIAEIRAIFKDSGVILIFFGAGLLYPLLYGYTYWNEALRDIPVAVVDQAKSSGSRKYIRMLDATPEVSVLYTPLSITEAKHGYTQNKVMAIVLIPESFGRETGYIRPSVVQVYCNMASMIYYKGIYAAVNYVTLEAGKDFQINTLTSAGLTLHQAEVSAEPFRFISRALFNPGGGFASFLMPAVLILIIQQTLVLGVGMLSGTRNESVQGRDPQLRGSVISILTGKGLAYFGIYVFLTFYNLVLIPALFGLPQEADPLTLWVFLLPFLLACVCFSTFLAAFFRERESSLLLYLFTSLPLLFLSGFSWPSQHIPVFWSVFASFFPSTFGIQGFLKINSMGAPLSALATEWYALWAQVLLYAVLSAWVYTFPVKRKRLRPGVSYT